MNCKIKWNYRIYKISPLSHSRKNRQQKASKNRMNRNNSFIFVEVVAFIPRLA